LDSEKIGLEVMALLLSIASRLLNVKPTDMALITGCPRSGTTALLEWLNEHDRVVAFNESRILIGSSYFWNEVRRHRLLNNNKSILAQMLRSLILSYYNHERCLWRKYLIEKSPLEPITVYDEQYRTFLQNVRELFPLMKMVFMVRHPLTTIWSMRNRNWGRSLVSGERYERDLKTCISIWKANANLLLDYVEAPHAYICKFERLISEPDNESRAIYAFLGLKTKYSFMPKPTKKVMFLEHEEKQILEETFSERKLLGY
jgi:hypothetical protein